jgi:hypothetical protein
MKPNVNMKKNINIIIKPYIPLEYALTIYGYTNNISKSNNRNNSAKIKKEMLNCVLFWPRKEWNPHSNALFFSWYGLWGDNIILTANSISANIGMNIKKNVKLVILYIYKRIKSKSKSKN